MKYSVIPLVMLLASVVLVTGTKGLERSIKSYALNEDADIVPIAFQGLNVDCVAIDPKNPAVVYAGVEGRGLYKSMDYGISWIMIRECLSYSCFKEILVDPMNTNTLYWNDYNRLLESTDGGSSWFEVYKAHVDMLMLNPKSTSTLYAGSYEGVAKSIDGGNTWQNIFRITQPGGANFDDISGLLIDPYSTDTIYVFHCWGYGDTGRPFGISERIFKSFDGGLHWIEIFRPPYTDPSPNVYFYSSPALSPCDSSVLYAGVQNGFGASYDGGSTWFKISDFRTIYFSVHPAKCGKLYASNSRAYGLWTSNDGGVNWQYLGLNDKKVNQIAIDPQSGEKPERIYIATSSGLYYIGPFRSIPRIDLMEPKNTEILSGTVFIKARISSTVKLKQVEFFVDGQKIGEANPSEKSKDIYTCTWDTRQYEVETYHPVKLKALNELGYAGDYETPYGCRIQNVKLKAKAEEIQERSWLICKRYVKLTVNTENPNHVAIDRYVLYRNTRNIPGALWTWRELKTYNANEVSNGTLTWFETLFPGLYYIYRVEARDAKNTLLATVESNSQF